MELWGLNILDQGSVSELHALLRRPLTLHSARWQGSSPESVYIKHIKTFHKTALPPALSPCENAALSSLAGASSGWSTRVPGAMPCCELTLVFVCFDFLSYTK